MHFYTLLSALYRGYLLIFNSRKKTIIGIENIPADGKLILIANHISWEDPWTLSTLFPPARPIRWLSKKELHSIAEQRKEWGKKFPPFISLIGAIFTVFIVRMTKAIPVDRDIDLSFINKGAIRAAKLALEKGEVIGIFPEGGIGRKGQIKPIFIKLAKKYRAPLVMVKICKNKIVVGPTLCDFHTLQKSNAHEEAKLVMDRIYAM